MTSSPPRPKTTLAEQLKILRLAKGHHTARGFAKSLGISENRYSRYERGEAVPKLDLIWAICSELNITPNELYGWDTLPGTATAESPPAGALPRQHREQSFQLGLADSPVSFVQPANAHALAAIDSVALRLASAFTEILSAPGSGKLAMIKATVELASQLKKEPFETIAFQLQSLERSTSKSQHETRITALIENFLELLGSSNGRI